MNGKKNIDELLKELIKKLGLDNAQFAHECGIKAPTLSSYVNGKSMPRWGTLRKIVERFHVHPVWLLTGQGPTFQTDAAEPPEPGSEPEASPALTPAEREMETFVRLMRENTDPQIRKGLMAKFGVKIDDEKKLDGYLQGISESGHHAGVHEPDLDFGKDI